MSRMVARWSQRLLTCGVLLAALGLAAPTSARGWLAPATAETIALAELPAQGQAMYRLILQGGPFRHEKDGVVFANRERLLPPMKRGYYREYTVRTPGERSRGARRIVCGGLAPAAPEACWYSADHYASFSRIVEKR